MTKILSPEEMAEDLTEKYYQSIKDILDVNNAFYYSKQCALLHVETILSLFLGEKSCVPVQGQHLVMDINYWIQVRNKLKEI